MTKQEALKRIERGWARISKAKLVKIYNALDLDRFGFECRYEESRATGPKVGRLRLREHCPTVYRSLTIRGPLSLRLDEFYPDTGRWARQDGIPKSLVFFRAVVAEFGDWERPHSVEEI